MPHREEDREDLLREATALVERIELQIDGFDEPIVAGFRRDGAASFFFGQQVVYQFNAAGQLRRGFLSGRLLKSNCGQLAELTRQRTADAVNLLRHNLTAKETSQVLAEAGRRLRSLRESLWTQQFRIVGQMPAKADIDARVLNWLDVLPIPIAVASSPRVG